MRIKFEDIQEERRNKPLKLLQDQPHRWLGTVQLLERFLLLWQEICIHYHRNELLPFPLDGHHKLLIELFSVVKPVSEVIISAHNSCTVSSIETYLAMCNLYPTILCDTAPLPLMDPALSGYKKGQPCRVEQPSGLETITTNTRKLLRLALEKRFYHGYNGTPRPLTNEMQVFMHPIYRKLSCLDRYVDNERARDMRKKVKAEIHAMALSFAKIQACTDSVHCVSETNRVETPSEKPKLDGGVAGQGIWNFPSFEEGDAETEIAVRSLDEEVMDEIKRYVDTEKVKICEVTSRKLLKWWKSKATQYPMWEYG